MFPVENFLSPRIKIYFLVIKLLYNLLSCHDEEVGVGGLSGGAGAVPQHHHVNQIGAVAQFAERHQRPPAQSFTQKI